MHRETITHLVVTRTDFVITGSIDGHVKFWKKQEEGIEFVKHFRCHLAPITGMCDNFDGTLLCTISADKSIKIFDVVNFDMINMLKLSYVPSDCSFIHSDKDPIKALCLSEKDSKVLRIYDSHGTNEPIHVLEKLHYHAVHLIKVNSL